MLWLALYVASIVAANVLIVTVGLVPVGFGLLAPAGVYAAGFTLTLRDLDPGRAGPALDARAPSSRAPPSRRCSPRRWPWPPARPSSSPSWPTSPSTPRCAGAGSWAPWRPSNAVGLVVDSALFLALAFGSLTLLPGLVLGKVWATLLALLLLGLRRRYGHPLPRRQSA